MKIFLALLAFFVVERSAAIGEACDYTGKKVNKSLVGSNETGKCSVSMIFDEVRCRQWDHNGWLPDQVRHRLVTFTYQGDVTVVKRSRNFAKETFNLITDGNEDAQISYKKHSVLKNQIVAEAQPFLTQSVYAHDNYDGLQARELSFGTGNEHLKVRYQGTCIQSQN